MLGMRHVCIFLGLLSCCNGLQMTKGYPRELRITELNPQRPDTRCLPYTTNSHIDPPVPVMPNTLFCGGSTTKAFTAAAMSMLVDTGSLGWKTKVVDVLREDFVLQDEYATREITIEDILSHRTGMPRKVFRLRVRNRWC